MAFSHALQIDHLILLSDNLTVEPEVFLHHLTPLQTLSMFTALWLTIIDFMDKYMHADKSDHLEYQACHYC
ncbi:Golgi-specific brefeldin A-resistance guanine nucleotide exchange factor 1-like isoform X3 [Lycorma delicatula]|uniref:Golgi-specific brefeldin A-resistance guanine nucleotide exchange factor 1-like isoform X3 n=1 Tax=Lycorma delicatula TaxID=130591 RepID=UPI003F515BF1